MDYSPTRMVNIYLISKVKVYEIGNCNLVHSVLLSLVLLDAKEEAPCCLLWQEPRLLSGLAD